MLNRKCHAYQGKGVDQHLVGNELAQVRQFLRRQQLRPKRSKSANKEKILKMLKL